MNVVHRLVGYDRVTDREHERHDIPDTQLQTVIAIAEVGNDDPEAAWTYALSAEQAARIAELIGARIDIEAAEFFLEAFATTARKDQAA